MHLPFKKTFRTMNFSSPSSLSNITYSSCNLGRDKRMAFDFTSDTNNWISFIWTGGHSHFKEYLVWIYSFHMQLTPPSKFAPMAWHMTWQDIWCQCTTAWHFILSWLPWSNSLFVYQKWSCPEAGEVLKRNSVPDWPLIATYLISEASLSGSSRWSNYISALPRQPYSLLYW